MSNALQVYVENMYVEYIHTVNKLNRDILYIILKLFILSLKSKNVHRGAI